MDLQALWYAGVTFFLLWGLQLLWRGIQTLHTECTALISRWAAALRFLEEQATQANPRTGVVVEGSVFAESLCEQVLRIARMNDRKLGETMQLQLRQREDIENLIRTFGQEFKNIVHDLGYRVEKLVVSMDQLIEQLELHEEHFKRIRRTYDDLALRAKALVINNENNYKQVKMSFSHLRSVLETDVTASLNGMHALLNAPH